MYVPFPVVSACSFLLAVGVIYVTVIAPIIAMMAVLVAVVLQILLLPITVLTGQRMDPINIQRVFNELMPSPLHFFQRLYAATIVGRPRPSRRCGVVASQNRPGRVRSVQ